MHATTQSSNRRLGELGGRIAGLAGIVGVAGVILSLAIAQFTEHGWATFNRSYLTAFMFVLSISLGGLFFTMIHHITRAGWSVVLRRIAEGLASNLQWIWILFIPVLGGYFFGHMYEWGDPKVVAADDMLRHKAPYFFFGLPEAGAEGKVAFPTFWLLRAVLFFAIWFILARFFVNNSIAQDSSGDVSLTHRMQKFAPLGLILYAITQTFAAFDWMMSLEPHWFSTMYPVYFFAASMTGFFAVNILVINFLQRNGRLTSEISLEHYQDAGKLLFAFGIVFWAYIAFSQFMLIWYANIPEETMWYLARVIKGWEPIAWLLLLGHFAAPFVAIISRHPKRMPGLIALAAAWMLAIHFIDLYWLIKPHVPGQLLQEAQSHREVLEKVNNEHLGYGWSLLDFTCLVGLAGLLVAGTARKLSTCSLIPERDPRLHESLAFENM